MVEKYIAPSLEIALEKIRTKYSTLPSISGRNSAEIVAIRKAISQYSLERTFGPAFMIVAPHTHWCKGLPILISVDGENYALSEDVPKEETTYYPVSFAFTSWGLLAYEWADETVPLQLENMKALWRCAESVATKLRLAVSGFGLSINFRFKSPMDNMIVSTIEYQDRRSGWSGSSGRRLYADRIRASCMARIDG